MEPKVTKNTDLIFNLGNFKNYLEEKQSSLPPKPPKIKTFRRIFARKLRVYRKHIAVGVSSIFVIFASISGGYFFTKSIDKNKSLANAASTQVESSPQITQNENEEDEIKITTVTSTPEASPTITISITSEPVVTSVPIQQNSQIAGNTNTTKPKATQTPTKSVTSVSTPTSTNPPTQNPTVTNTATPEPTALPTVAPTATAIPPTPTVQPTSNPTPSDIATPTTTP
jgi:hypothetical protein